jgi:serine/threonine-protein kinase
MAVPTPPRDPAAGQPHVVAHPSTQDTVPPTRPVVAQVPGARPLGSRYLLDQRIGRGATGHVWAGRRRDDGFPVAVKLLRSELAEDPDVVMRFLREKSTLTRLRHPNLVQVHDLVAEGEVLAIVMDLVRGEDLRRRATRGPLSRVEAAVLLAQTAGALAAVHAARVVHRDVKPENILVTERDGQPTALLTDFGIARALEGPALTRPTQLVGTPAYIAPELAVGRAPEPASDVYSLGVTAYELLAGHRPFQAEAPIALLRAHVEDTPVRPPGIDDATWALIAACLAKAPADRPSAAEVAVRWATLAQPGELPATLVPAPPPPPGPGPAPGPTTPASAPGPTTPASAPAPAAPARQAPAGPVPTAPPAAGVPQPTAMSARPLAPPPTPDAARPRRRRWPIVVAAVVVALVGASTGVYLKQRQEPDRPAAQQSSAPATRANYFVPVSIGLDAAGTATLTWDPETSRKPGFQGFFVVQFVDGGGTSPVTSAALPGSAGTYSVTSLRPGRRDCFGVLAYGVTEPPLTPVPQACVTPR